VLIEPIQDERGNPRNLSIAHANWLRTPGQKRAAMVVDLPHGPKGDTLVLEIENGDNPPLEIDRFQFHYPATRILFKASPEAETFLYYGNHKATSPRYDLVLIATRLVAADKTEATLSPAESLHKPSWQDSLPLRGSPGWLFWIVLGLVAVVLLLVIRRLLPKSENMA
jgi:hypothetical protein